MIQWSQRARLALPLFYDALQDIEVYVEDEESERFYEELLGRLLGDALRVERVFCLGGRDQVLAQCVQHNFKKRPAVFIVDGDLLWVREDERRLPQGCVELTAYCVENFLFCERAATEFLYDGCGARTREELRADLAWSSWYSSELHPLVQLFIMYATANALDDSIRTVSEGLSPFISTSGNGPPCVNAERVSQRIRALERELEERGFDSAKIESTKESIEARIGSLDDPLTAVSGKDFLLPALRLRCHFIVKQTVTKKSLYMRLARYCDLNRLEFLRAAMYQAVRK